MNILKKNEGIIGLKVLLPPSPIQKKERKKEN